MSEAAPEPSKPNNGILIEGPLWKKGWVGWSLRWGRLEETKLRLWKDKSVRLIVINSTVANES